MLKYTHFENPLILTVWGKIRTLLNINDCEYLSQWTDKLLLHKNKTHVKKKKALKSALKAQKCLSIHAAA